ncbi:MAG: cysteine--tRNA ligase [Chlamydiia bacterium]|nr:cysteine--tRNA ligase [Chlamydiia bacterium]
MLQLKDTRTKTTKSLCINKDVISIYTCGPTVYDFCHIGNFRTFLWEDILVRTIKFLGTCNVFRVMNFTDVDDKTIARSISSGQSLKSYTEIYIDAFLSDANSLNLVPANKFVKATDYIPSMIHMIENLVEKDLAYEKQGSVYFCVARDKGYGRLVDVRHFERSKNIDNDEEESVGDFVLWKAWRQDRDGDAHWESPWGKGRPGWHIECSAMILEEMGESIDIHAGGVDNIFPHHENEIAQTCAATNSEIANIWMHVNHLLVDGKKMSKKLNNYKTVKELLDEGHKGFEIRFALLSGQYELSSNFTYESLGAGKKGLKRIKEFVRRLCSHSFNQSEGTNDWIIENRNDFKNAMLNNLNLAVALSHVFELISYANAKLDENNISEKENNNIKDSLRIFGDVLGFNFFNLYEEEIPSQIYELADRRGQARKTKDWKESDTLRDKISGLGYKIEDRNSGYVIHKIDLD